MQRNSDRWARAVDNLHSVGVDHMAQGRVGLIQASFDFDPEVTSSGLG